MYEPVSHYRKFDDETSEPVATLAEAQQIAREMRDARDPAHQDRSDMGVSVWKIDGCTRRCVWSEGYVS